MKIKSAFLRKILTLNIIANILREFAFSENLQSSYEKSLYNI